VRVYSQAARGVGAAVGEDGNGRAVGFDVDAQDPVEVAAFLGEVPAQGTVRGNVAARTTALRSDVSGL
jgi:hypothetical protein